MNREARDFQGIKPLWVQPICQGCVSNPQPGIDSYFRESAPEAYSKTPSKATRVLLTFLGSREGEAEEKPLSDRTENKERFLVATLLGLTCCLVFLVRIGCVRRFRAAVAANFPVYLDAGGTSQWCPPHLYFTSRSSGLGFT